MKLQSIEACANFAEKAGQIIAALIREQPECIGTPAFQEFVVLAVKFANAIEGDSASTIKGSEIFEEFSQAKERMQKCLEAEQEGEEHE